MFVILGLDFYRVVNVKNNIYNNNNKNNNNNNNNHLMAREGSLALVGNLSNDVTIKIVVGGNLKTHLIKFYGT